MKNSKLFIVFGLLVVLALDFAALDDITTGNEPNYFGEWIVLLISLPLLFFLTNKFFAELRKR